MAGFRVTNSAIVEPILIQVGALRDLPTANMLKGKYGDTIVNGGLSPLTGIYGPGNSFKTYLAEDMLLMATNRLSYTARSEGDTLDTEINKSVNNFIAKANRLPYLDRDFTNTQWFITNKNKMSGEAWATAKMKHNEERIKDKKSHITFSGRTDPNTGKDIVSPNINGTLIDSWTLFGTSKNVDQLEKSLADPEASKTMYMNNGMYKDKLIEQLLKMGSEAKNYFILTAHSQKVIDMRSGPAARSQMQKALSGLKQDEDVKGVSPNFFYLTQSLWQNKPATNYINANRDDAMYPTKSFKSDTDLKKVRTVQLRSKSGASNYTLSMLISQKEGVKHALTEFAYCRENFVGFTGELKARTYSLILMPEVSLSRTTIRDKLDASPKLTRAMNITAEHTQMVELHFGTMQTEGHPTDFKTFKEMIDERYDWDIILATRGWYTPDHYKEGIQPALSIVCLLDMAIGKYIPYFMEEKDGNLKVKKGYLKWFIDEGILDANGEKIKK